MYVCLKCVSQNFLSHFYFFFVLFCVVVFGIPGLICWSDSINFQEKTKRLTACIYAGIMAELTLGLSACRFFFHSISLSLSLSLLFALHTFEVPIQLVSPCIFMCVCVCVLRDAQRKKKKWKMDEGAVKNEKECRDMNWIAIIINGIINCWYF